MDSLYYHNKTVIITGASAGVGAACARAFAKRGSNLVLAARGEEALSAISRELQQITPVLPVVMDVANTDDCAQLMKKTVEKFGNIHILINNAGLHHRGDVESRTPQELMAMVDVNLRAPIQLSAEALPYILESGIGAIIMVGSLAGRTPLQGAATYAATKAGLRAFSYALADELQGTGIVVGLVSPGPIDTGFIMDNIDQVEDIVYSQPMSSAQQVADRVLQLLEGRKIEITMPWLSGKLTTLSYLSTTLRRMTRGLMYSIGRKNKRKYRQRLSKTSAN
jgi:short-subunit dehydrogenase